MPKFGVTESTIETDTEFTEAASQEFREAVSTAVSTPLKSTDAKLKRRKEARNFDLESVMKDDD